MTLTTRELYDRSNRDWERDEPVLLSDFTARPFLLEWCRPVQGADVLDLGCGEGYVARALSNAGAGTIQALDISGQMIKRAREKDAVQKSGIVFATGDATDLGRFGDERFDLAVAVFLFNYLTLEQTARAMGEVHRVLRKGGKFIFAVPHPALPFLRDDQPPFFFSAGKSGYFSGRGRQFEGEIWRRDDKPVAVRCIHKNTEDYFDALRGAGFDRLPEVKELGVTEQMLQFDRRFFSPLSDLPLHLALRLEK